MAVVTNEFGELGIDEALIGEGGAATVELAGGCVCCKLSDELSDTLQMLHDEVAPDRIVVETSGVAMPFETQLTFWREPVVDWVEDDAAVVVVNAEQLAEGRDLEGTWTYQVESADLLLLNKVDLVEPGPLVARLAELAPGTPILQATHGQVDPALLFPPDPQGLRATRRQAPPAPPPHHHEHFATEELAFGVVEEADLEAQLKELGALRVKGFVRTPAGPRLVQGVGRRLELTPAAPPEELLGRIVVIRRA